MKHARILLAIGSLLTLAGCAAQATVAPVTAPVPQAAAPAVEPAAATEDAVSFGLLSTPSFGKVGIVSCYGSSQFSGYGFKNSYDNDSNSYWGPSKYDREPALSYNFGRNYHVRNFRFRASGYQCTYDVYAATGNGYHVKVADRRPLKDGFNDFAFDTYGKGCRFVFHTNYPERLRLYDFVCNGEVFERPISDVPPNDRQVLVRDYGFYPPVLTIFRGTAVTWRFLGPSLQCVVGKEGGFSYDSGVRRPGDRFSVRFDRPGIYTYSNDYHRFRGKIIVR